MKAFTRVALALAITLIILMMTGCGSDSEQRKQEPLEDVVLAPPVEKVNIPEKTLEPCRPLPRMKKKTYTEAEMVAFENEVITIYDACKDRQKDLAAAARKAFNLSK